VTISQAYIKRLNDRLAPTPAGCIEWQGAISRTGYGIFSLVSGGKQVTVRVHRLVYELAKGPIPDGLVVDHLCRNPRCANIEHLEAVTVRENTVRGIGPTATNSRKTQCKNGHDFNTENTAVNTRGQRQCRICNRAAWARWDAKRKEIQP
jgi:hypothetical protein